MGISKSMLITFTIPALISALSILGAYLAYQKERSEDKEKLEKEQELNRVYQKLQAQSEELNSKSNTIIDSLNKTVSLQEQLITYQRKNEELQNEITNQITGGDSKPHVSPFLNIAHPNEIGFDIINQGKYPVMDLSLSIININAIPELENLTPFERRKVIDDATSTIGLGTLAPEKISILGAYRFPNETREAKFRVNVSWRKGYYSYYVEFAKDSSTGRFKVTREVRE